MGERLTDSSEERRRPATARGVAPPDRYLPPLTYRDLPEPVPLRRVLGPGVILLAAGLGSGEFVLWPYVASQVGLVFLWAALAGVGMQYVINMEVERYTLATGETAVTGFTRLWKPWGALFAVMAILPNAWPGWTSGGATILTYIFGGGNVAVITICLLVLTGLVLTFSPVIYSTVEKIVSVKIAVVVLFFAVAVAVGTTAEGWKEAAAGTASVGTFPTDLGIPLLVGALAFAGVGGTGNLVISNWVRDKGFGMGAYIPRIVSPITGEESAGPAIGHMFPTDEANLRRWRGWWRVANREQLITFVAISAVSMVVLSVLAYSTVYGRDLEQDIGFIEAEGEALSDLVAPWFGLVFWIAGAATLIVGYISILDYVARLCADAFKVSYLRKSTFWTESRLYVSVVWGMIVFASVVLLTGLDQPVVLLVISSSLSGVVMFIYSILLARLNRRHLPHPIRLRGTRFVSLNMIVLAFGVFSVILVADQVRQLVQ